MTYLLKEITPATLQQFVQNFPGPRTFLQGAKYGTFRQQMGENVLYQGIFQGETLVGTALIQKVNARRGTYLHIPHGPLILPPHRTAFGDFLEAYKALGKEQRVDFIRVAPLLPPDTKQELQAHQYRPAPVHLVNPERTWTLNLAPTQEELLAQMKKSTRYEVRRTEKCGLTVKQGNTKEDLDAFWDLHTETVKRQGFVPFSRQSTEAEMQAYQHDCQIFTASDESHTPLASSIILYDDHAGYYHQGASLHTKLPASHATLWAAIQEAKRRGCTQFNFWGICAEEETKHPWWGLSRFKRGFGGREEVFVHVHDFPLTKKYWLNWAVEKYRRWKRGY